MNVSIAAFSTAILPYWILVLAGAALAFYIAARAGAAALDPRGARPGAAAVAHWLPMAAVTLAALKNSPQAAVNVIFASSVACLTLVPGVMLVSVAQATSDDDGDALIDRPHVRAWPTILAAGVLALLAGFSGSFKPLHALVLALQGVVAIILWTGRAADEPTNPTPQPVLAHRPGVTSIKFVIWIVFSLTGALLSVIAIDQMSQRVTQLAGGVVASLMLAPALVLPMIGSAMLMIRSDEHDTVDPAMMNQSTRAVISLCVGCVLLNLCVLLPLTIVTWQAISALPEVGLIGLLRGAWLETPATPLAFPLATWRVDTVLIVVAGAALVPIAAGRWFPRRMEGLAMLAAYTIYMSVSAALARR